MLTKKDYNELVRIIKECTVVEAWHAEALPYDKFINRLCFWLRMNNPNFDESRFRAALQGSEKPQMTKRR